MSTSYVPAPAADHDWQTLSTFPLWREVRRALLASGCSVSPERDPKDKNDRCISSEDGDYLHLQLARGGPRCNGALRVIGAERWGRNNPDEVLEASGVEWLSEHDDDDYAHAMGWDKEEEETE